MRGRSLTRRDRRGGPRGETCEHQVLIWRTRCRLHLPMALLAVVLPICYLHALSMYGMPGGRLLLHG